VTCHDSFLKPAGHCFAACSATEENAPTADTVAWLCTFTNFIMPWLHGDAALQRSHQPVGLPLLMLRVTAPLLASSSSVQCAHSTAFECVRTVRAVHYNMTMLHIPCKSLVQT
jgi:hypothetical protein